MSITVRFDRKALISIKLAQQQLPSGFLWCHESDVNLWNVSGNTETRGQPGSNQHIHP